MNLFRLTDDEADDVVLALSAQIDAWGIAIIRDERLSATLRPRIDQLVRLREKFFAMNRVTR